MIGQHIGPYRVVSKLGEGGMGEVYRAHDTSLGRDIALKVLKEHHANDRERLARFDREARILASLTHPNIATIHGVTETASGPALVLELVEGPTLADRLAGGRLPLAETLRIARQVADALETAHERGVVHRDLKPANVKLRPDGTVKVLDFGIAKMLAEGESSASDDAATLTATAHGVLLGTPAYMSPEQIRGAEITRRTDVWAFGAILFEMLTGQRAFAGSTSSDVMAAVLQSTPDWSALPSTTPPAVTRLVQRCLQSDTKARLHDIGDARLEIEDVERTLRGEQTGNAQAHTVRERTSLSKPVVVTSAALAAIALLAVGAWLFRPGSETPRQEVRLQMAPPPGMHFISVPAVSPDGRQLVFVAVPDAGGVGTMWLRPLAASTATELPGTTGASYPFWSPDGRAIGFFADGKLKRVSAGGGNSVVIGDATPGRGGLWLDDDTIVFAAGPFTPLMRVNAAGGASTALTTLASDETGHRFPQRVPGRQLLYFSVNRTPEKSGTRLVNIDDPNRSIAFHLTPGSAEYVKGFLVFPGRTVGGVYPLLAQRISLPEGRLAGDPLEIGRVRVSETLGRVVMATAPTGVIATLGPSDGIGQMTWMSRDGRVLETVGDAAGQLGVELSPDGQQVATHRPTDIWTMNLARPIPSRVTRGLYRHPMWLPDGSRLLAVFQGRGIGTFDLVTVSVNSGEVQTIRENPTMVKPIGWGREGRIAWIEGAATVWSKSADGQPEMFLRDGSQITEARISLDGRWVALASDRSGRFQVEVRAFPGSSAAYPVSEGGGGYPRWRADGRELFFLAPDGRLMAAAFTPGSSPTIGRPVPLFETQLIAHPDRGNFAAFEYDVSADGKRFLINRLVSPPENSLQIIIDWATP
jgi:serine/threonine protein kinase/Tol biopolymer transport system component